ncbi:MAG TPA: glutamate-1-semialdehyde 2,1-aminomutase [Syntrophorhabdaceae bacterium]|nr:glutamate-1-semialdehyde 2,1-aminomutase [Syntrophorhabdaceae bacterium]
MNRKGSHDLYGQAVRYMPGGVNSPVRAFLSVHDEPFYVKRGKGAYLYDVDGNSYLDYVASWGAIILGHADDGVNGEVKQAIEDGTSYGACHPYEIEMAKLITGAFPSIELVRLTSSGTEATMSAIRLARGFTGKGGVVKFRGCYHGHLDSLLVKAGSGLATFGIPDSEGILPDLAKYTFIAEFNNIESVRAIVEGNRDIACVIVEPIMGNMGVVLPENGFLKGLERICRDRGILLIFDEVITGFRVAYGGAQHIYGIKPDITCLGKIIGGGFPIGAFGGRKEIMECLAPLGAVYQAGTLSGNPVAVRAGICVLTYLKEHPEAYAMMRERVDALKEAVLGIARRHKVPYRINGITGMFTGFFTEHDVRDDRSASAANRMIYERFFKRMLEEGVFFAPSPFEASFVTLSHGDKEMTKTVEACERVFKGLLS